MTATSDIVQKLWNLCKVLRQGGVTYHQYVNELTFLLFLKMAQETERESQLPEGLRWNDLVQRDGVEQLNFYRQLLLDLGAKGKGQVSAIFANATTVVTKPATLSSLVSALNGLDWYNAREEGFGDLYEGLLEKNATEVKRGAGQYFTPRPLIECMVSLMQPQAGELIQDPAVGTGGFLINADRHIKGKTDNLYNLPEKEQEFQRRKAFYGMEYVQDVHRLCLMNMLLHDLDPVIINDDTLGPAGARLEKADCILTNPPFGTSASGAPSRGDFTFPTSNSQLAFLQHIYRGLKPKGRAAVVLPDNVLFEDGVGQKIRADLMDKCNLHTVLRLPTGIFYAQGVKTNVLFFQRGEKDEKNTKDIWFFDLRTNMPNFGKRTPLTREHFADFEYCYGKDPNGISPRKDQGERGRFRRFSREDIAKRNENLDITWLRDESSTHSDELPEPDVLAAQILEQLAIATSEMEALTRILEGDEDE